MPIVSQAQWAGDRSWLRVKRLTFAPATGDVTDVTLFYNSDTNHVIADPGSGNFRWDDADQSAITEIAISATDRNGQSQQAVLAALVQGQAMDFTQDVGRNFSGVITGPVVDNTGWFTIPWATTSTIGSIQNNKDCDILVALNPASLPVGTDEMEISMAQEWPWIIYQITAAGESAPKEQGVLSSTTIQSILYQ